MTLTPSCPQTKLTHSPYCALCRAKKHAEEQGGKILLDLDIIKGFSYVYPSPTLHKQLQKTSHSSKQLTRIVSYLFSVSFPDDAVNTLESSQHVKAVELDQEVRIQ